MKKTALIAFVLGLSVFFVGTSDVSAASCNFTRDLEEGMEGEDVRCLQKFLNDSGITIATSGVGSPGRETNQFRTLTKEAVITWQKQHNLNPPIGYFGPLSRAKYTELSLGGASAAVIPTAPSSALSKAEALALVQSLVPKNSAPKKSESQEDAENMIKRALDEIDDLDEDDDEDKIQNARRELLRAVVEYFDGEYAEARITALGVLDVTEIDEDDIEDIEDDFERLTDYLETAKDEVDDAEDDGDDVDRADDLLDDAEDLLDEAEDAIDDEDYDDAKDLLERVEEKIDDALDEIGVDADELRADEAIEAAEDAIDDARKEIDEAEDDGEDIGNADTLLDEAKDDLEDAKDYFDDEEWENAIDSAEDAVELVKKALDEF